MSRQEAARYIGVYGSSGFGREVMPLVRAQYPGEETQHVFIDDSAANGDSILSFQDFAALPGQEKLVTIAIANSVVREKLAARCHAAKIGFAHVQAANTIILDDVEIGEGAILCAFSHVTSTIRIGRFFNANFYAYVAHDCIVGDFVTLAPGAQVNGNIHIGDHAYIGSGAVIKQGTPERPRHIGSGAIIGMGAVVTRDVAPGETVVGNPARIMALRQ